MIGLSVAKFVNDSFTHIFSPNNFPELRDSSSKCLLNVSSLSHRLIKHNVLKTEYPLSLKRCFSWVTYFNKWDPSVTKDRNLRIFFFFILLSYHWIDDEIFLFVFVFLFFCFFGCARDQIWALKVKAPSPNHWITREFLKSFWIQLMISFGLPG